MAIHNEMACNAALPYRWRWCFLFLVVGLNIVEGARFAVTGPVLTLTLKDENTADSFSARQAKWGMDLSALRPNLMWSISSLSPPLPNWLPAWKSLKANVGYRFEKDARRIPAYVESDLTFSNSLGDLQILPSYDFKSRSSQLLLQAGRGSSYALARFTTRGRRYLDFLKASYHAHLPFSSVGSIRLTPSFDFVKREPACVFESTTGSGRTKAILTLDYQDPKLAVVHALDEHNTIAPEISLYTARITYQWNVQLDSGSIHTKVDPTSEIQVTWTDFSRGGGKWVTDFRLPLTGTTVSALAADIRVRRQFQF